VSIIAMLHTGTVNSSLTLRPSAGAPAWRRGKWQTTKINPLPIARRLWQHARRNGTAVAIDRDAGLGSVLAPNRSDQHSVATIPDRRGDLENLASIATDRTTNP
jgi:hypothetical protein